MKYLLSIFSTLLFAVAFSQADTPVRVTDTGSVIADTAIRTQADSLLMNTRPDSLVFIDSIKINIGASKSFDSVRFTNHPFFSFTNPIRYTVTERRWQGKEAIFYSIIGLLLFFSVIKNHFNRYFGDLFRVFFRTSLRQKQLKEQLLQSTLASLLFNIFFVLSIGLFLSQLFLHYNMIDFNSWLLALYCIIVLAVVYAGKFLFLKIAGWIFQSYEAANTYIFVVFTTNKILGIIIIPFLIAIAFTDGPVKEGAMAASIFMLGGIFLYRYIFSYLSVKRFLGINFFHFLIYLVAFEIVPLLLINKVLFNFIHDLY